MPALEETPDYLAAHGDYLRRVDAATAAEHPDLERLRAENWWLGRRAELREQHTARDTAERTLTEARAAARAAHPQLTDAALAALTTPEQIAAVTAAMASLPAPSAPRPRRAGGPPASTSVAPETTPQSESERRWQDREYLGKLVEDVTLRAGDGTGRTTPKHDELMDLMFDNRVAPLMGMSPDGTPREAA